MSLNRDEILAENQFSCLKQKRKNALLRVLSMDVFNARKMHFEISFIIDE